MKKKGRFTNLILVLALFVGLSLLLYPAFSDYWNSLRQSRAITVYSEAVAKMNADKYNQLLEGAYSYNESITQRRNVYLMSEEEKAQYEGLLNVAGDGAMGYIEIPAIGCSLPIYHGVDEKVLQKAIGHLDWTSLPVGGEGTHCVVSGHRGLPSARLFTDLDMLVEGDIFIMRILDEVLTYEVDQILIVEPHESDSLLISEGEDYCTLVTCTPYGVNSHRLLVRGHRVENQEVSKRIFVTADAIQIDPVIVAPVLGAPMLLLLLIASFLPFGKKKHLDAESAREMLTRIREENRIRHEQEKRK